MKKYYILTTAFLLAIGSPNIYAMNKRGGDQLEQSETKKSKPTVNHEWFECPKCGAECKGPAKLMAHIERGCSAKIKAHTCFRCNRAYSSKYTLKRHNETRHQIHNCIICKLDVANINEHMATHAHQNLVPAAPHVPAPLPAPVAPPQFVYAPQLIYAPQVQAPPVMFQPMTMHPLVLQEIQRAQVLAALAAQQILQVQRMQPAQPVQPALPAPVAQPQNRDDDDAAGALLALSGKR